MSDKLRNLFQTVGRMMVLALLFAPTLSAPIRGGGSLDVGQQRRHAE